MKKFLLSAVLLSFNAFAEDCNAPLPLDGQPVVELMNYKCFNDEISKEELPLQLGNAKNTKKFCKKCNNPFVEMTLFSDEAKKQKRELYSETVFNELNKELSFITLDLMKARSSFSLPIDSKEAEKSCQLSSIAITSCLFTKEKKSELQHFNQLIKKSQNAIATELANILSPKPGPGESLFKRVSINQCNLMDSHVLYAQMRYEESLLTKDLIDDLGQITFQAGKTVDEQLEQISKSAQTKTKNFSGIMKSLLSHPIIKSMISEPDEFKNFMTSIPKQATNDQIIERLYQTGPAKQFSKTISNRCTQAIKQTSELVEKIYCSPETPFIADSAKSMAIINKKNFGDLSDDEAEKSVQRFCGELNNLPKNGDIASFNEILKINQNNDSSLVQLPIENFKMDAFGRAIGNDAHAICEASKNNKHCEQNEAAKECRMLQFHDLLKTNKSHQSLANSSNSNINDILRSLIGTGLPQDEAGIDSYAVDLLRKEGILPGAEKKEENQSRDVASFHREINRSQGPKSIRSSSTQVANAHQEKISSPTNESNSAPNNQNSYPSFENSNQQSPKVPKEFSSLSESEQKKILNFLKTKQDKIKTTQINTNPSQKNINQLNPTQGTLASPEPTYSNKEPTTSLESSQIMPKILPKAIGQLAKSNQKNISESFNKALQDAQLNRSPASQNITTEPSLSLTTNKAGINEIDINVSEEEFNKVAHFKEKLKELLNTHSEEIMKLKEGEKFLITINNHEIILTYDQQTKTYEAKCNDKSLPVDYLKTISHYFNVTLKEGPGKREALLKAFKVSQNTNLQNQDKTIEQSK